MSREMYLRNLILDHYSSLRQFALEADIPYSSLMTILSRGVGGASFDIVMRICQKLSMDPTELTESQDGNLNAQVDLYSEGLKDVHRAGGTHTCAGHKHQRPVLPSDT